MQVYTWVINTTGTESKCAAGKHGTAMCNWNVHITTQPLRMVSVCVCVCVWPRLQTLSQHESVCTQNMHHAFEERTLRKILPASGLKTFDDCAWVLRVRSWATREKERVGEHYIQPCHIMLSALLRRRMSACESYTGHMLTCSSEATMAFITTLKGAAFCCRPCKSFKPACWLMCYRFVPLPYSLIVLHCIHSFRNLAWALAQHSNPQTDKSMVVLTLILTVAMWL